MIAIASYLCLNNESLFCIGFVPLSYRALVSRGVEGSRLIWEASTACDLGASLNSLE